MGKKKKFNNPFASVKAQKAFLPKVDDGSTKINLRDIAYQTCDIQDGCRDKVVDRMSDLIFVAEPEVVIDGIGHNLFDEGEKAALTEWATTQLCQRYEFPVMYAKKCLLRHHADLFETNIRTWLDEDGTSALFRLYDDMDGDTFVRGIVSTKYTPFDAPDIVKVLAKTEELSKKFSPRSYYIDPERMHIRFVADAEMGVKGENLYVGVMSDSSDVGKMSVNLKVFIMNAKKGNAFILPYAGYAYRQIHVGKSEEGFAEDIRGIVASIPTMEATAKAVIEKSKSCKYSKILDLEDEKTWLSFAKAYDFSLETVSRAVKILESQKYGAQESLWALVNSLTEAAETLKLELEEKIAAEKAAGNLLYSASNVVND